MSFFSIFHKHATSCINWLTRVYKDVWMCVHVALHRLGSHVLYKLVSMRIIQGFKTIFSDHHYKSACRVCGLEFKDVTMWLKPAFLPKICCSISVNLSTLQMRMCPNTVSSEGSQEWHGTMLTFWLMFSLNEVWYLHSLWVLSVIVWWGWSRMCYKPCADFDTQPLLALKETILVF